MASPVVAPHAVAEMPTVVDTAMPFAPLAPNDRAGGVGPAGEDGCEPARRARASANAARPAGQRGSARACGVHRGRAGARGLVADARGNDRGFP